MGAWRKLLGASLLLALPTTFLMTLAWACRLQWLRGLWGQAASEAAGMKRVRQSVTRELSVPEEVVGYVIGRHGARVRQIEEETGAQIRFKDVQASRNKVAVVRGKEETVEAAEEMLRKVIEERSRVKVEAESVSIAVPSSAVGRIIGRQGANIKTLQRESGAKITIPRGGEEMESRDCVEAVQQSELARKRQVLRRREELRDRHRSEGPPQLSFSFLPSSGEYFGAFVSSVEGGCRVWLQVVEGQDPTLLDSLVAEMTEDYCKLLPEDLGVNGVGVGMTVAAPFQEDKSWYRAMVTSVDQEGGHAELLYLDFGDRAGVGLTQLKRLRSEYYRLPVQAICCQLAGIQPKGSDWSEGATEEIARLTLCALWRVVMVRVCTQELGEDPTVHIVDTTTNKDVDVAEQLVELGLAEWGVKGCDRVVHVEWKDEADSVGLAGSFSQWRPLPMRKVSTEKFEVTLRLLSSVQSYQCKFLVDGNWQHSDTLPTIPDGFGGLNNVISV